MEKPDVDAIEGLSPAIAIDQKTTSNNPRSTVGTVTEIYDYLRLLYARVGKAYCPKHDVVIESQTIKQMADTIDQYADGDRLMVVARVVKRKKGTFKDYFADLLKDGYLRVVVDGQNYMLDEDGVPSIVERAYVMPPRSFLGVAEENLRQRLIAISPLYEKYAKVIDRESAYEILQKRAQEAEAAEEEESLQEEIRRNAGQGSSNRTSRRSSGRQQKSAVEKVVDSALSTFGRTIASANQRRRHRTKKHR